MTAEETFPTLHEGTHRWPVLTAANGAAQTRSKTAAPAGTDRVNEALGLAAPTAARFADKDPMATVDHLAGAGPATGMAVAGEHHPAQPRTSRPGRFDQ